MKAWFLKWLRLTKLDALLLGLLEKLALALVKKLTAFQNAVRSLSERLSRAADG